MIKLIFSFLLFCCVVVTSHGQQNVAESEFRSRLDTFFKATERLDMVKVVDLMYPAVFRLASKEDLTKTMQDALSDEDISFRIDSCKVIKLYPVINWQNGEYRKIDYSFLMYMQFAADSAMSQGEDPLIFTADIMREQYGAENILLDTSKRTLRIKEHSTMIAAKDETSPRWTFADIKNTKDILSLLFKQELLDKLEAQP